MAAFNYEGNGGKSKTAADVREFRQYVAPSNALKVTTGSSVVKPVGTSTGVVASPTVSVNTLQKNQSGGSGVNVGGNLQSMYQQQQNNLASQLQSQQAWYEEQLRAQQAAREQAARNAYDSNMSALQQAYQQKLNGLSNNLESTKNTLAESYGNSQQNINNNAEKSLQEAYINRMMNEKNLRQQLNAQGLNGGASESAIASMLNNYGTSRNNINNATADSLRSLEQNYNSNLANAMQNYNDAVSSAADTNLAYKMQLENDLANAVVGSYNDLYSAFANMDSNYTNSMTNLINNQSAASADLQQALYKSLLEQTLKQNNADVTGATETNDETTNTVNKLKQMYQNGASTAQLLGELGDYSDEQVLQYFAAAGIPV